MKNFLLMGFLVFFLSACATTAPEGILYSGVKLPINATASSAANKEGRATCYSVLALVAVGDCSINTAARNGGISEIQSVDNDVINVLGVFGSYTTIVWGR